MKMSLSTLKSLGILASKPHGTRIRYMAGCKCTPCKAANSRYECHRSAERRAGRSNEIIDATPVRKHLNTLSKSGIGRRTISDITGIGQTAIQLIKSGSRKGVRRQNAEAILAVDLECLPESALVSAAPTWRRLNWLLKQGFTKCELARRLGYKSPALQINRVKVTARTALKIERFYNQITAGDENVLT